MHGAELNARSHDQRAVTIASAFDPRLGSGRLLRRALFALAAIVSVKLTIEFILIPTWGVDIVVPLRAAARWLDGSTPYLASSFQAGPGYDVPYLYPPVFLPLFAPLTRLPIEVVIVAANIACLLCAYGAARRLGLRPAEATVLLLWPPISGTIADANLALPIFAAFVFVFWEGGRPRDLAASRLPRRLAVDGTLAALIPAIKVSQAHAWVGLLKLNPRSAAIGALVVAAICALMLPLTGFGIWRDWLDQLARASDPSWALGGAGLTRGMPASATAALALVTMALTLVVPARRAGAWIGLLTVIGAPSLRVYGALFALPAMLELRREIGLVAGMLIASYTLQGLWLGLAIVAVAYLAAGRMPALLEPTRAVAT